MKLPGIGRDVRPNEDFPPLCERCRGSGGGVELEAPCTKCSAKCAACKTCGAHRACSACGARACSCFQYDEIERQRTMNPYTFAVIAAGIQTRFQKAKRAIARAVLLFFPVLFLGCSEDWSIKIPDASSPDAAANIMIEEDGSSSTEDAQADAWEFDAYPDADTPKDAGSDAKACPPNDVSFGGKCFYLDGSKGKCDLGYAISSNAKLAQILAANPDAWQGKNYRYTVSDHACVLTSDQVQNYGMVAHANINGPFSSGEPKANGSGCWMVSPPFTQPKQLTLCESTGGN